MLSPFGSNCCTYLKPLVIVAWVLSVFRTVTSTKPTACAPVFAVSVFASTRMRFVGMIPPIVTAAPVRNPLPLMVNDVPPLYVPLFGVMLVMVTGCGTGVTVMFTDFVSEQPPLSTLQVSVAVPAAVTVK